MLPGSCLPGELVPAAVPNAAEEELAMSDDEGFFDLPFFCAGRLIAGVNW